MNDDVLPQRNLGAGDPWGRKIEDMARDLSKIAEAHDLAIKSANRTTAGQLGVVGRQIEELGKQQDALKVQQDNLAMQQQDLIGRVSYTNAASPIGTAFPDSGTYPMSDAAVTFRLTERRTVQVIATMHGYITSIIGPSSPIARLAIRRGTSFLGSVYARGVMSTVGRNGFEGSVTSLALVQLAAGTHTLTPAVEFTKRQAGDGFICNAVSITVNVLQKS